jgi:hypothetical protein
MAKSAGSLASQPLADEGIDLICVDRKEIN